jgi:hypothetical protein
MDWLRFQREVIVSTLPVSTGTGGSLCNADCSGSSGVADGETASVTASGAGSTRRASSGYGPSAGLAPGLKGPAGEHRTAASRKAELL